MDSTSLRYKLTLETSSDKAVMLQDEQRPLDMNPVLSTNIAFRPAMFPSALKTTPGGKCLGLYSEDFSTCSSRGIVDRDIFAVSPEAGRFTANQLQSDSHISLFSNYPHNPCERSETSTNSGIYQSWPLEYSRAAPVQIQTDPNDLDLTSFSHSQYYGAPISGGTLPTAGPGVPMHLGQSDDALY